MTIRCDGKTCTCGIGPWSNQGVCDECGGIDLGLPIFGTPTLPARTEQMRRDQTLYGFCVIGADGERVDPTTILKAS